MPFIQGARTCGGMRLARLELSAGLNAILKRFEVQNADASISFDYALALRPRLTSALTIVSRRPR
jgi:cytochrome P450